MKFRVPAWYDPLMDVIAMIVFPSRKYLNLTLAFYAVMIAVGMVWWSGNWLWAPGVLLCGAFAYIMDRMMYE